LNPPFLGSASSSRWMVFASIPVCSIMLPNLLVDMICDLLHRRRSHLSRIPRNWSLFVPRKSDMPESPRSGKHHCRCGRG
jgi:hypothetical protein